MDTINLKINDQLNIINEELSKDTKLENDKILKLLESISYNQRILIEMMERNTTNKYTFTGF